MPPVLLPPDFDQKLALAVQTFWLTRGGSASTSQEGTRGAVIIRRLSPYKQDSRVTTYPQSQQKAQNLVLNVDLLIKSMTADIDSFATKVARPLLKCLHQSSLMVLDEARTVDRISRYALPSLHVLSDSIQHIPCHTARARLQEIHRAGISSVGNMHKTLIERVCELNRVVINSRPKVSPEGATLAHAEIMVRRLFCEHLPDDF